MIISGAYNNADTEEDENETEELSDDEPDEKKLRI